MINNPCKFLYVSDFYGDFSNFARIPVRDANGKMWQTSEALYQAMKFAEEDIREKIRLAPDPYKAKAIARAHPITAFNWESEKVDIMYDILMLKAQQHKSIKDLLESTGDRDIIEVSKKDAFWGTGPNGDGVNMLGKLWMRVRATLRETKS